MFFFLVFLYGPLHFSRRRGFMVGTGALKREQVWISRTAASGESSMSLCLAGKPCVCDIRHPWCKRRCPRTSILPTNNSTSKVQRPVVWQAWSGPPQRLERMCAFFSYYVPASLIMENATMAKTKVCTQYHESSRNQVKWTIVPNVVLFLAPFCRNQIKR